MVDQESGAAIEMPRYKCHKEVWALQIDVVKEPMSDGSRYVFFKDQRYSPVVCPPEMFARFMPGPDDYYICYRDDYRSFSPQKEFEDGYSLVN